ncbi:MAG TPA: hypothetical protein PLJ60_20670, partial [Chryseolinea sp.]|nr:hypothetical protein [Chryseolinea sp.]
MKSTYLILATVLFLMACNTDQTETVVASSALQESQKEDVYMVNTLNQKVVPDGLLILNGVDADDDLEHA